MEFQKRAVRLALTAIATSIALAACSSGGGGGSVAAPVTNTPAAPSTPTTPTTPATPATPTANANLIGPPGTATIGANSPNLANGTTTNFSNNSAQSINVVFALRQTAMQTSATKVSNANISSATATFQGLLSSSHVPLLDLKVPSLGLDIRNLRGDAVTLTLPNGDLANGSFRQLDYTIIGQWAYSAAGSNTIMISAFVTGYQTPTSGVPASGAAAYVGNSGPGPQGGFVSGRIFTPDGNGGIVDGSVSGAANVNVNFSSGAVSGTLNGMQTNAGTTPLPWNTVNLAGSLSGAAVAGTTSTSGAPSGAGALGFSSAATGTFSGALYGPAANEVGAVWSLAEPTLEGGKAVQGTFMGTRQ